MARFYNVSNTFDPFAVSIMNDGEIVGHVPQRILASHALFLQHHWSIRLMCRYIAIQQREGSSGYSPFS